MNIPRNSLNFQRMISQVCGIYEFQVALPEQIQSEIELMASPSMCVRRNTIHIHFYYLYGLPVSILN